MVSIMEVEASKARCWYGTKAIDLPSGSLYKTVREFILQRALPCVPGTGPVQSISPSVCLRSRIPACRSKIACCSSHSPWHRVFRSSLLQAACACKSPPQKTRLNSSSSLSPATPLNSQQCAPLSLSLSLSDSPPAPSRRRFFSTTPHRSPIICTHLERRHPVASHAIAKLFHYHATPIISLPFSNLYSIKSPAHPPSCRPIPLNERLLSPRVTV
jgi:hypothetical protein